MITVQTLRTKTKAQTYTQPRWFAMAYLHATGRYSMPQIARALKLEDHTTVLYGLRRAHGHDGKWADRKRRKEPLWNKEQFENMAAQDAPNQAVTAAQIDEVGMKNLARFTSGSGWAA